MNIRIYCTAIVWALFGIAHSNGQHNITVIVPNVKSTEGNIMVCLVDQKTDYLKNCMRSAATPVKGKESITHFQDLPSGNYVVTIFHDKNKDEKLNTNFIGIPKEAYGFSNNPMAMFGPPSFEKCAFKVDSDTSITVKL